jgi:hypothetical protein
MTAEQRQKKAASLLILLEGLEVQAAGAGRSLLGEMEMQQGFRRLVADIQSTCNRVLLNSN